MATFEIAIVPVLEHEGSRYTNNPADPGGSTKWGVTLRSAQEHNLDIDHDGDTDVDDIKNLTIAQATEFYHLYYWKKPLELLTSQSIATKVFDTYVNVGSKAIRWLQQAVATHGAPLSIDGVLGPQTVKIVNGFDEQQVLQTFCVYQGNFYISWCNAKTDRAQFKNGLLKRAVWIPGK